MEGLPTLLEVREEEEEEEKEEEEEGDTIASTSAVAAVVVLVVVVDVWWRPRAGKWAANDINPGGNVDTFNGGGAMDRRSTARRGDPGGDDAGEEGADTSGAATGRAGTCGSSTARAGVLARSTSPRVIQAGTPVRRYAHSNAVPIDKAGVRRGGTWTDSAKNKDKACCLGTEGGEETPTFCVGAADAGAGRDTGSGAT